MFLGGVCDDRMPRGVLVEAEAELSAIVCESPSPIINEYTETLLINDFHSFIVITLL